MGAQSRHPSGPGTLNLDFEETSEPEPEGLSAFAFALIVCLCVAYWYGVAALFFFGTLNDSPVMVILGCILAPIPCITVGALRWRELHNRRMLRGVAGGNATGPESSKGRGWKWVYEQHFGAITHDATRAP